MRNTQKEWVFPDLVDIPANIQTEFGGSSVFNQTLFRRGIQTIDSARGFLNPGLYLPASPSQLPGLPKAVDRIQEAFKKNQKILVWGDFDVDGQTSTTLLVSALSGHGSEISHYIPNRALESHGVSVDTLQHQISQISPSILLTCDTGIDAFESVSYAQSAGIDVIITDHHQLPNNLPSAYSIVNPNFLSEHHPLFNLPGVGVAYKLIEALYSNLQLDPEIFLDLVALGIVSDVARQTHDTRYLLQKGLVLLQNTSRLGLQQLLSIAKINPEDITEETIGFVIGPRLNALGRLDDANSCVEFFTTPDLSRAAELAQQLESLNSQRRILTETIFQDSIKMVTNYPEYAQDYPILVLQGPPQWHPGVIGIVASRLVERFHKPVIMLSQDGKLARGSARSIPG
ncbi:MAG: DHH family phosphoesterase, partial [Anaerolineales bacterium]|nr:DHH family phosphoesterase [Anaerolineales bacterium]